MQKPKHVFEAHWQPAMQGCPVVRLASHVPMEHHELLESHSTPQIAVQPEKQLPVPVHR